MPLYVMKMLHKRIALQEHFTVNATHSNVFKCVSGPVKRTITVPYGNRQYRLSILLYSTHNTLNSK